MDILKIAICVGVIVALYSLCFSWPVKVNRAFRNKYGVNGWSYLLSVIIAILAFAAFYESGHGVRFVICLMAMILLCAGGIAACVLRAVGLKANRTETLSVACSQILFSFGVLFAVLLLFDAASEKKRH